MGSLKKFAEWLSGGYAQEEQTTSPLIKVKVFNKRLARQIRKMEVQEKINRKKAIEARKEGDIAGSKMHMKNSLQYRKWSHSTEHFRMKMENIQFKLEQAKVMGQFSDVATDIVGTLQGLNLSVKMPEVSKMLAEMDLGFGHIDSVMEGTTEQLEATEGAGNSAVSDDEVEQALAEVDAEESIDSVLAMPAVPMEEGEPEVELDNLEDEIKRLKESRNN